MAPSASTAWQLRGDIFGFLRLTAVVRRVTPTIVAKQSNRHFFAVGHSGHYTTRHARRQSAKTTESYEARAIPLGLQSPTGPKSVALYGSSIACLRTPVSFARGVTPLWHYKKQSCFRQERGKCVCSTYCYIYWHFCHFLIAISWTGRSYQGPPQLPSDICLKHYRVWGSALPNISERRPSGMYMYRRRCVETSHGAVEVVSPSVIYHFEAAEADATWPVLGEAHRPGGVIVHERLQGRQRRHTVHLF